MSLRPKPGDYVCWERCFTPHIDEDTRERCFQRFGPGNGRVNRGFSGKCQWYRVVPSIHNDYPVGSKSFVFVLLSDIQIVAKP